jgi:glycosyltransferase involved in cell wall biosynthesis
VRALKILHVLRAPVGGLFRHVIDLARGQAARGHSVGLIADSTTGAARAEATLADLAPRLALGLRRVPMSRHIGPRDIGAARAVSQAVAACRADVVHGHGAKGGAYARLAPARRAPAGRALKVYTPHGGSLHYSPRSPLGMLYLNLERLLLRRTDLFLFESEYGRMVFGESVGKPVALTHVVHNGVEESEFAPVELQTDATDLLFVGELRRLKGVDVLIEAIGLLGQQDRPVSATIVGDGPDGEQFRGRATALGLNGTVNFAGPMPARTAFARGRVLVVPSRAESLPYIVLEGAAARVPMIATAVGGIPEIFGPDAARLVPPGDAVALATVIRSTLHDLAAAREHALRLQIRVHASFAVDAMTDHVLAAYAEAITATTATFLRSH